MAVKFFERHAAVSWLFVVLIGVGIFYVSSLEFGPGVAGGFNFIPTLYHILAFFLFAFFLVVAVLRGSRQRVRFLWMVILIAVLYAISDELHQLFVPGRSCALYDLMLDFFGVLVGVFGYLVVGGFRKP